MRRGTLAVVLALAAIPAGVALANNDVKVTGGGQVLLYSTDTGPGDTIAFTAQQTGAANQQSGIAPAKGELQVINRTTTQQEKFHGDVTCIRDVPATQNSPHFVRFGGVQEVKGKQANPLVYFTVDADDNGEGINASDEDMIEFRKRAGDPQKSPCDNNEEDTDLRSTALFRGNVQEH